MKRLLLGLLLLMPFLAHSQQTFFTPGVMPKTISFTPTFRIDTTSTTDSLKKISLANGNKSYLIYQAAVANKRFALISGSTNYIQNGTSPVNQNFNLGTGKAVSSAYNQTSWSNGTALTDSLVVRNNGGFKSIPANSYNSGAGTTGYITQYTGSTTQGISSIFNNSGNIGIGTVTPFSNISGVPAILDLAKASGAVLLTLHPLSTTQEVKIAADGTALNIAVGGSATASNNLISFSTDNTNSNYPTTERARITSDGKFFVGYTADPTSGNLFANNGNLYNAGTITASIGAGSANNFVVSNSGLLQYRTAAQVLGDIGAAPSSTAITAIGVTTANGISGTSSGGTTPNLTIALGAITPTSTNGVSAATMAFNDATSSIQTQLNSKIGLASLSATSPIFYNNSTGVISSQAATTSLNGYLTSTDWNTFNGKQATITFGTGVQTALGVNIGSAGAPVLLNGAGGTPASIVLTNATGTASALNIGGNAATVTTNANLTGVITSTGNATSIASQTGTGTKFVMDTSPTLITPALGTPSSINIVNATGLTSGQITTALGYTPNSGAGSANYIAKYTGTNTQGVSPLYTNGTQVSIGTTSFPFLFTVKGSGSYNGGIFADNTGTTGSGQFQVGINGTSIGSLLASGTIYGNTNANLALDATNGIDFFVNGGVTPSVTIDKTTGNLTVPNIGVGITPVGSSVSSNIEWVNGSQIASRTVVPQMYISSNITGTPYSPTRYGSGYAMQMVLDANGGAFNLNRAVSSTAGSSITWLNDLSFDNSGNATFGGNITAPTFIGALTGYASLDYPIAGGSANVITNAVYATANSSTGFAFNFNATAYGGKKWAVGDGIGTANGNFEIYDVSNSKTLLSIVNNSGNATFTGTASFGGNISAQTITANGNFVAPSGYVYSQVLGAPAYLINSAGINSGYLANINPTTWALGFGSSATALGTTVLTWNQSSNVVVNGTLSSSGNTITGKTESPGTNSTAMASTAYADAAVAALFPSGTWTPASSTVTLTVNYTYYQTVGKMTTAFFYITFPVSVSANQVAITGLPGAPYNYYPLNVSINTSGVAVEGESATTGATILLSNATTHANVTYAQMSGAILAGSITYRIP